MLKCTVKMLIMLNMMNGIVPLWRATVIVKMRPYKKFEENPFSEYLVRTRHLTKFK